MDRMMLMDDHDGRRPEADTLLHTCCAPCSIECIDCLEEEGLHPLAFFSNSNIHPLTEFQRRLETLRSYSGERGFPLVVDERYQLDRFLAGVARDSANRCRYCYDMRLRSAARKAKELSLGRFTTTLLISPYQDRETLCRVGRAVGREYGLEFLEMDPRSRFRAGQQRAVEMGMYRQKYCGCIYSERDRYSRSRSARS